MILASQIKEAIRPLGQDIDDDVFDYLGTLIKETISTSSSNNNSILTIIEDICSTYIPGYIELSKNEQTRIANKLQNMKMLVSSSLSSSSSSKGESSTNTKTKSDSSTTTNTKTIIPLNFSSLPPVSDDIWNVSSPNASNNIPISLNSLLNPQDLLPEETNQTPELSIPYNNNDDDNNTSDSDAEPFVSEIEILMKKVSSSQVSELQSLFPHLSDEISRYILGKVSITSTNNATIISSAAEYILEHPDTEKELTQIKEQETKQYQDRQKRRKEEYEKERKAKAILLHRYDEREDDSDKKFCPTIPKEMQRTYRKGEKVLKYLDGKIIHMKPGEKYFVEENTQEYGTAHSLKIKKKGQGGKSPGFK